MAKINEWLSEQIEESGKSQTQIAREAGIDNENVTRWIKGVHEPSGFFLKILLDYFNYEIRIDGKSYGLDELGRYTDEQKKKRNIYRSEISKKLGKYPCYIEKLILNGTLVRFSKFEEVVNAYGGKVEICRKK